MQTFFSLFGIVTLKIHQYLFLSLLLTSEREIINIVSSLLHRNQNYHNKLLHVWQGSEQRQLSGFLGPAPNAVVLTSPISTVKLRRTFERVLRLRSVKCFKFKWWIMQFSWKTGFGLKSASIFIENRLRYRFLFKIADTFFLTITKNESWN